MTASAVPLPIINSATAPLLSVELRTLAVGYVQARARAGEALIEAAHYLAKARASAQHGEWGVFLEATNTSEDVAEGMLRIAETADSDPRFARALRGGQLSQTVAMLYTRESTPPAARKRMLDAERPPSKRAAQQIIKEEQPAKFRPGTEFEAAPTMLMRTTTHWAETDLGALLPRNERQRMRYERLAALLEATLPPLPDPLRHTWTRWQDDDTGRIWMQHASGYKLAGTDPAALETQATALARPLAELIDHGWRVFYDPSADGRAGLHAYTAIHEAFSPISAASLERLALVAWHERMAGERYPDMPGDVIDALWLAGFDWSGRAWTRGAERIDEHDDLGALRYELGLEARDAPLAPAVLRCTQCGTAITNGHFDGQCGPCYRGQPPAYRPTNPEWNAATARAAAIGLRISQADDGAVAFRRMADNGIAGGAVDWSAALELLAYKEQTSAPGAATTPAPLAALAAKLTTPEAAISYRAIGMLLRASGVLPALPTRPKAPRSADISDQLAYMGKLEAYADAMDAALKGETA